MLNVPHTSHQLLIYLFSSPSVASKAIQHSDADLWDSCRETTEFNEAIGLIMQDGMKSGNLNKITEAKFAETATWSKESILLTQQSFKMLIKSFSIDLGITCISDTFSLPHWDENNQSKPMISNQQPININKSSWQQSESPISDLSSSNSESTLVLQKYSDVRLDKQFMMNTSNLSEGFLIKLLNYRSWSVWGSYQHWFSSFWHQHGHQWIELSTGNY